MDILLKKNLEPLRNLIDNLDYREIAITRPYSLNIETMKGAWLHFEDKRLSLEYLYGLSKLLAVKEGKRFNEEEAILSATIENKHRVNIIYGKQTNHEIAFTIRLKRNSDLTLDSFAINEVQKQRLVKLVEQKKNILISGGTGTGKTTLLNSLIRFINPNERIITIENAREIEIDPLIHKNHDALIYLQDKQERIAELLNASLRMRPDRILIGELRIENSYIFLRAANSGHEGTISTIHANSPQGAIDAMIHNIKSGTKLSHDEIQLRQEITKNISAIIQLKREYENGKMLVAGYLEEIS